MPIFEYACIKCDERTEQFITSNPRPEYVPCKCGSQAFYRVSAPRFSLKMGLDTQGAPTMADKWERAHIQKLKQEAKQEGRENELPAQYR